jgi:serine O-acetyltransferase
MFDLMREDVRRKQDTYVMTKNFVNSYLKVPFQHGTVAVVFYRFASWLLKPRVPVLREMLLLVHWLLELPVIWLSGVDINPRQRIGKGFVIHNFSNIVVDSAGIGEGLTINQGVTIGPDFRNDGKPRLGNNVFVGSGAVILGNIDVGDDVVIAANAVVTKTIAARSVVAGNPGMVIKKNLSSDYVSSTPARVKD